MTPEELQAHFRQRLELRIKALESIFPPNQPLINESCLVGLIEFLHKLSGAAGLYGFNLLSAHAKEAESTALDWQQNLSQAGINRHTQNDVQAILSKHLKDLHQMMQSEHQAFTK